MVNSNKKFRCFLDYEELALLIMFANLHHKMSLLVSLFSSLFSESLPNLDEAGVSFLVQIVLHFFQKNQILNPDMYKLDPKNTASVKKRNFEDFNPTSEIDSQFHSASENSKIRIQKNKIVTGRKTEGDQKKRGLKATGAKINRLNRGNLNPEFQTKNMFSFVRMFMRNSALEILNLFEVSNAFLEKLLEFNLQSNSENRN